MLLDFLGEQKAATLLEKAIGECLVKGPKTPDIGGTNTTVQVGDWVASRIQAIAKKEILKPKL